jgi:hypothetical protein
MGVGGQHHTLATLPLGKTRYPLYRRLGGPQGWSGQLRKISPPLGFNTSPTALLAPTSAGNKVSDDRKTVLLSKILCLKNFRMIDNEHNIMFAVTK